MSDSTEILLTSETDLQATAPRIALSLDRVGVTGIIRGIVLSPDLPATAYIDVAAELPESARGAHMSRFHEAIDQASALVADDGRDVGSLELLTTVIASRAAELQDAPRAYARVEATVAWPRLAPASGRRSIDPIKVWAAASVDRLHTVTEVTLGVEATGMTACPCAQELVRSVARERLTDIDLDADAAECVLDAIPIATHNQRSTGVLELTVRSDGAVSSIADPLMLADLIRSSMSSPIHELLKREDELAVVIHAHDDPRFVEDCVRALLSSTLDAEALAGLDDATIVRAWQRNHESIHAHDVEAERSTTLGVLRAQLRGA